MPASPETSTTAGSPSAVRCNAASSTATSAARPTNGRSRLGACSVTAAASRGIGGPPFKDRAQR